MARDGKVSLGRKLITMQLGQLFVDRASINLHSDILDNPDYFWEDDEWLPAYARVAKYLEITRRAEVLNKRLDIIKELFDMLASEYHNSHASMLEYHHHPHRDRGLLPGGVALPRRDDWALKVCA